MFSITTDNVLGFIGKLWSQVTNPPAELVEATIHFGQNLSNCAINSTVNYGEALLEVIKNLV
jgi:hypothetical protein